MLRRFFVSFFLFALFLFGVGASALAAEPTGAAQPRKVYRFFTYLRIAWGGETASSIDALFAKTQGIILSKTGLKIEFTPALSTDDLLKKLKSGEADFAALESPDYIRAVEQGVKTVPMVHLAYNGRETANICIYVRKNSPEMQGIAALKNKRVAMIGLWDWLYLQEYMKGKNIDKSVRDYFSDISLPKNDESALYALIFNKTDAFVSTDSSFIMAARTDKRFKDVVSLACMGEYPNGPMVMNPRVDKSDVEQLVKIFLGAHKDKDFKDFRIYFVAANARFVRVDADFYTPFIKRFQKARKAGWINDFEKWRKQQPQK